MESDNLPRGHKELCDWLFNEMALRCVGPDGPGSIALARMPELAAMLLLRDSLECLIGRLENIADQLKGIKDEIATFPAPVP